MKLGPITIGGRRDGSGYQHSTATIVITPEDGDTAEDCLARATDLLAEAFEAAEAGVDKRGPKLVPAPKAAPMQSATQKAGPPLQSFPATEVGKMAQTIVKKAAPTAAIVPERAKAPPVAAPAQAPEDDGLKRRVAAWRKSLTELELSETDFLRACGVTTPEDLKQLNQPLTRGQLKVFVDDVAKILDNADNLPA